MSRHLNRLKFHEKMRAVESIRAHESKVKNMTRPQLAKWLNREFRSSVFTAHNAGVCAKHAGVTLARSRPRQLTDRPRVLAGLIAKLAVITAEALGEDAPKEHLEKIEEIYKTAYLVSNGHQVKEETDNGEA